ncbi:hypothetical protein Tco_1061840 [Tanacetum coccineum]
MASMKYCDKHNQVGFLKKPEESTGFAEIVDFLKGSHIRYALTHNPTIHDSLVKQFWQTATASTLADGTLELRATIDTLEYTITEASVRSKRRWKDVLKRRTLFGFTEFLRDEDAELNFFKQGRNLQEEGLDEMGGQMSVDKGKRYKKEKTCQGNKDIDYWL